MATLGIDYLIGHISRLAKDFAEMAGGEGAESLSPIRASIFGVVFTMVNFYAEAPTTAQRPYIQICRSMTNGPKVFQTMIRHNAAGFAGAPEKLLSELTDEELTAAVEGKALLALTVEYKNAAKKVGGAAKKAPKPPAVSAHDLAASLNAASTRTAALNLIEGSKPTVSLLNEVAALLNLPAAKSKAAITNRIVDHIGSRADAQVLRNW